MARDLTEPAYAGWLLERVDPTHRITHAAIAARVFGAGHLAWRTRSEHDASPDHVSMAYHSEDRPAVHPSPAHRPRAALRLDAGRLVEDLLVLLRRQWKR